MQISPHQLAFYLKGQYEYINSMLMRLAFHLVKAEAVLWLSGVAGGRTPITHLDKYWSRGLYRPLFIHLSSQEEGVGFITEAWLQTWCQMPLLFVVTMQRALGCTSGWLHSPNTVLTNSHILGLQKTLSWQLPSLFRNKKWLVLEHSAIHFPWGFTLWYTVMVGGI